jgi:DNA polymerase-3 subunit alpha
MMFATLDDLGGTVEMLVFGKALAEHEAALAVDEVVLVTGRVDHKEAAKTCLIVQAVERFSPSQEEIESARTRAEDGPSAADALAAPVHLRVDAARLPDSAIDDLKQAIEDFPGPAEVVLDLDTSAGTRRLKLGEAYRVQHTPALRAELEHALAPTPGTSAPAPSAPAPAAPPPAASAPAAPPPAAPAPAAPASAASVAG